MSSSNGYLHTYAYRALIPQASDDGYLHTYAQRVILPTRVADAFEYVTVKPLSDNRLPEAFEYVTAQVVPSPTGVLKVWDADAGVWKPIRLKRFDPATGQWRTVL